MKSIQPVVVDVSSTDWEGRSLATTNPTSFGLHVEIGEEGQPGADLFQMSVCNPAYLNEVGIEGRWSWRGGMLVLEVLSFEYVREAVEDLIRVSGPYASWPDFAARLAPHLDWEFKGMPYPPFPA